MKRLDMKNIDTTLIKKSSKNISIISSGKMYKYEYLTGEEILPVDQSREIEEVKFSYSPLWKQFEKQTITIED